jgi:hypothetical protein
MQKILKRNPKVLATAVLVLAFGCLMASELALYKKRPIKFSHKIHLQKAELNCEDCHTKFADSDKAGMPAVGACKLCHNSDEDIAKYLKPFEVEGKVTWTNVTVLPEETKFSHKLHNDKQVDCEQCHIGVKTSEGVSGKFRVEMDDCNKCHAKYKLSSDCKECHTKVGKDWKPESHEHGWTRMHGQVSRAAVVPPMDNRCSMCHTDNYCATCHQDTPPANHNNYWRIKGHAVNAEVDRDSCKACHRTDFCDRCHFNTAPRSHTAGWGSPKDRHCNVCHFPAQNEECFTCHKTFNGHLAADPLPNNVTHHTASENACRNCHATRLRHVDNGDSCRNCHR